MATRPAEELRQTRCPFSLLGSTQHRLSMEDCQNRRYLPESLPDSKRIASLAKDLHYLNLYHLQSKGHSRKKKLWLIGRNKREKLIAPDH